MTKKLEFCDLTVVIPAFNCEGTLSRALASVCNQTLLPTSIFVIDDRSTDKTFEVGMKFMESNHLLNVQVFQNKINLGPGPTRNFGWNLATSKYIAFLDADDAWDPRKLEIQVEWMEAHKNIDFTCTRTRLSETHADFQYPGFVATEIDFKKMLFRILFLREL
jgi:glycosyltransferase involved in cell wall biosynthesis